MRKYGWKRDRPDSRDYLRKALPPGVMIPLPRAVDNIKLEAPIFDQGNLGSCTGNAWAAAFEQVLHNEKLHLFRPSRLFIYYNERVVEGTVDQDAGAEIRDGIKVIAKYGVCPETIWPYDESEFAVKPTTTCYDSALRHLGLKYERVPQTLNEVRLAVYNHEPVVFGFNVYESFEGDQIAQSGVMSMPAPHEKMVGGHAVKIRGYDDGFKNLDGSSGAFLIRNSWGKDWGQYGYFWMPYKFFLDASYVSDIWALSKCD